MGWLIGAAVVVIVVGSILAGERDNSKSGGSGSVDDDGKKCEGCRKDRNWYNNLPWWKKGAYLSWFIYKKIQCNASGCPW